jgi:hypothetical protein
MQGDYIVMVQELADGGDLFNKLIEHVGEWTRTAATANSASDVILFYSKPYSPSDFSSVRRLSIVRSVDAGPFTAIYSI